MKLRKILVVAVVSGVALATGGWLLQREAAPEGSVYQQARLFEDVLAHVRLNGGSVAFASGGTLKQARARFEREYIAAVLEQHRGRISEAAKALGIQRTNLYRKLRSLKVARANRRHE